MQILSDKVGQNRDKAWDLEFNAAYNYKLYYLISGCCVVVELGVSEKMLFRQPFQEFSIFRDLTFPEKASPEFVRCSAFRQMSFPLSFILLLLGRKIKL